MTQGPKGLEAELKRIVERRIISEVPRVGSYSWICIARSVPPDKGQSYYKIGHTIRLEPYLAKLKRENPLLKDNPPLILEVWGGASYFVKVIRRIFKDKRISMMAGEKNCFALDEKDIFWLSKFRIAEAHNIQAEIYDIFDRESP